MMINQFLRDRFRVILNEVKNPFSVDFYKFIIISELPDFSGFSARRRRTQNDGDRERDIIIKDSFLLLSHPFASVYRKDQRRFG